MNDFEDSNPLGASSGEDENAEKTMSLLGGIAQGSDYGESDSSADDWMEERSFLNQGTLLLVIVSIIAAGGLYAMHVSQQDTTHIQEPTQAENEIERALALYASKSQMAEDDPLKQENIRQLLDDTDSIIAVFSSDSSQHQVPIEYLKKNPFQAIEDEAKEEPDQSAKNTTHINTKAQLAKLKNELSKLHLESVMGKRVVIISGKLYQMGQKIGQFTLRKIQGRAVQLVSSKHTFTLKMDQ